MSPLPPPNSIYSIYLRPTPEKKKKKKKKSACVCGRFFLLSSYYYYSYSDLLWFVIAHESSSACDKLGMVPRRIIERLSWCIYRFSTRQAIYYSPLFMLQHQVSTINGETLATGSLYPHLEKPRRSYFLLFSSSSFCVIHMYAVVASFYYLKHRYPFM